MVRINRSTHVPRPGVCRDCAYPMTEPGHSEWETRLKCPSLLLSPGPLILCDPCFVERSSVEKRRSYTVSSVAACVVAVWYQFWPGIGVIVAGLLVTLWSVSRDIRRARMDRKRRDITILT